MSICSSFPTTRRRWVYDLAYHFDEAGQQRKAWIYGLLAAEQARRQYAVEVATQQYAIADRNSDGTPDALRYRIAEGYGEALMLLGRYEEASNRLEGAINLTENQELKARIEALRGEIGFKQGTLKESTASLESGLRRLAGC